MLVAMLKGFPSDMQICERTSLGYEDIVRRFARDPLLASYLLTLTASAIV